jgi:hypothetical protein
MIKLKIKKYKAMNRKKNCCFSAVVFTYLGDEARLFNNYKNILEIIKKKKKKTNRKQKDKK